MKYLTFIPFQNVHHFVLSSELQFLAANSDWFFFESFRFFAMTYADNWSDGSSHDCVCNWNQQVIFGLLLAISGKNMSLLYLDNRTTGIFPKQQFLDDFRGHL